MINSIHRFFEHLILGSKKISKPKICKECLRISKSYGMSLHCAMITSIKIVSPTCSQHPEKWPDIYDCIAKYKMAEYKGEKQDA